MRWGGTVGVPRERGAVSDESYRDRLVDEVTEKVTRRQATTAEEAEVRSKAEDAVDGLISEPLQTFTPLLAENEVLSHLHGRDQAPDPSGRPDE